MHQLPIVQGYTAALMIIDLFTRYLWIIPCKNHEGTTVCRVLSGIFNQFGWANYILSDRAKEFIEGPLKSLEKPLAIKHLKTSGYHPQANGNVERIIKVVSDLLRTTCEYTPRRWIYVTSAVSYAYNTSYHSIVKATPFFLMFGRHPNAIPDEHHLFKDSLDEERKDDVVSPNEARQIRWAQVAAHHLIHESLRALHIARDQILAETPFREFKVDDLVYIHRRPTTNITRLEPRRLGPYRVAAKYNRVTYLVETIPESPTPLSTGSSRFYHASFLSPYHPRPQHLLLKNAIINVL
jgi:hypothetical protein